MECPLCGKSTKTEYIKDIRYMTKYRIRKCYSCELTFKTTEKPIFTSLPSSVRQKFLDTGERQTWKPM